MTAPSYDKTEHTTAMPPEALDVRPPTRLESQLDRLDQAVSRAADVLERTQRQLSPLSRPEPIAGEKEPGDAEYLSPISERVSNSAARIDRISDSLIALLDSLDV